MRAWCRISSSSFLLIMLYVQRRIGNLIRRKNHKVYPIRHSTNLNPIRSKKPFHLFVFQSTSHQTNSNQKRWKPTETFVWVMGRVSEKHNYFLFSGSRFLCIQSSTMNAQSVTKRAFVKLLLALAATCGLVLNINRDSANTGVLSASKKSGLQSRVLYDGSMND